jgi:hypothetical protein
MKAGTVRYSIDILTGEALPSVGILHKAVDSYSNDNS